ncbi:MAG: hypothetical protein FGM24_02845 [Candidatus Kapabacteria bacterium]|nr:hypothetical protein [Candidatus Kapabacteria bacterium]
MTQYMYRIFARSLVAIFAFLVTVSLTAQSSRLDVGDTVIIKPKYHSSGVILGFTGTVYCASCPTALLGIDALAQNLDVPMEVYFAEGMESSTSVSLTQQFKVAKVFDDETQAVTKMYRIDPVPAVIVVSPSGVVRYVGYPGTSKYSIAEAKRAIDSIRNDGVYYEFRGPVQQRARIVSTVSMPTEVMGKDSRMAMTAYDDVANEIFVWDVATSTTSFVLDSGGRILHRFDMSRAVPSKGSGAPDFMQWDNKRKRILLRGFDNASRAIAVYWYNLHTQTSDTLKLSDGIPDRRRALATRVHPETNAYIVGLDLRDLTEDDPHPRASVFVRFPDRDTFMGKWGDHFQRDSFRLESLLTVIGLGATGWYTSQQFTDTIVHYSCSSGTSTAYHVKLPPPYFVHHGPGMNRLLQDPDLLRSRKTLFSRLYQILESPGTNTFYAFFYTPAGEFAGVNQPPYSDRSLIAVHYDMEKRQILSAFELPQAAYPKGIRNGRIMCAQIDMSKLRIAWFAPPATSAPN